MIDPTLTTQPWAVARAGFVALARFLARLPTEQMTALGLAQRPARERPPSRGGVAIIPVHGYLVARGYSWLARSTYAGIGEAVREALLDPEVSSIVLDVDSPGGQVAGVAELSELIFAARRRKPVTAVVTGNAASAAYWIASSASRVLVARTALVGAIGVVLTFIDFSKFDEEMGIEEINIVSSQTPRKLLDLHNAEDLQRLQRMVDALADVFLDDVARNRGTARQRVVRDFGRGDVFVGRDAVTAGLADAVGTLEDAINSVRATWGDVDRWVAAHHRTWGSAAGLWCQRFVRARRAAGCGAESVLRELQQPPPQREEPAAPPLTWPRLIDSCAAAGLDSTTLAAMRDAGKSIQEGFQEWKRLAYQPRHQRRPTPTAF